VVLAANQGPTLNDVTAAEARVLIGQVAALDAGVAALVASGRLRLVSTGTRTPGIDFREVSPEFEAEAAAASLLVLEGQGRALETNWHTHFDLHVLRVSTVKDG